ncbi:MAG: 4'-phosphopantetheinyl transferase family protein [Candidatus Eisenbacteria bacterium]
MWIANAGSIREQAALDRLDATERERACRFRRPQDAHRFAAGRLLLRTALSDYLGETGEELRFESDTRGKLRLTRPWPEHPIHFSLSHAGEVLVVAIASRRVGVDVERVRPLPGLDAVARVCFTASELLLLGATETAERHELFFTMWTRKEAWAKALGVGLGAPLPSTTPDFPAGWSGAPLVCPAGYRAAVVVEGALTEVQYVGSGSNASACAATHRSPRLTPDSIPMCTALDRGA